MTDRLEDYLDLIERERGSRPSEALLADEIKRLRAKITREGNWYVINVVTYRMMLVAAGAAGVMLGAVLMVVLLGIGGAFSAQP